jgi:hypothetical protein
MRGVPSILDLHEIEPGPGADDEMVFGLVRRFARDFACVPGREESLLAIPGIRYHPGFDILCASVDGLPVTFSCGHIHDWRIGSGFFSWAERVVVGGERPLCASREHSIMLKARRMAERARRDVPLFGKDALDIINIVAAPGRRPDLALLEIEATARLVLSEACSDASVLSGLLRFIACFEPSFASLADALGVPRSARPRC